MSRLFSVDQAVAALKEGRLVGLPTETVYGLAADATNERAVAEIFAVKNRPRFNPLICHFANAEQALSFGQTGALEKNLGRSNWPGPLTLLIEYGPASIPPIVTAGSDRVGVRVPDHALTRSVLGKLNRPVAAPSANLSGKRSPTTAQMVLDQLGDRIAGVLDGGACRIGLESTVLRVRNGVLEILRPGALTEEMLRDQGYEKIQTVGSERGVAGSPGRLDAHYAPETPLFLVTEAELQNSGPPAGVPAPVVFLSFGAAAVPTWADRVVSLSAHGDLTEAAASLFRLFDELSRNRAASIVAVEVPERGLGRAINDRLRRAARSFRPEHA